MRLDAVEFLRRFLLHVLPKGFPKVRSYGFLANRSSKLERCRQLLGAEAGHGVRVEEPSTESVPGCPVCGSLEIVRKDLPSSTLATRPTSPLPRLDSS
jgi:hypothetical protein